jgi:hypothetical protein
MSQCRFELVCAFYQHRIPIHDAMYQTNLGRYCDGTNDNCAIHQVLSQASFLRVPADLYPNQTFRVGEILRKG